jgi:hypothetical protein
MPWKRTLRAAVLLIGAIMAVPASSAVAAPPPNDSVTGATVIGSLPFTDTVDTTEATFDADDASLGPVCGVDPTFTSSNSVWYAYTPSTDQTVAVDTSGSSYSVAGAIVTGAPGAFESVLGGCFLGSTTVQLSANTTYYIDLLESPAGSGGTLQVSVSELIVPGVKLVVDATGRFSKSGAATITGTATCSAGANAYLFANLTQPVGRIATITGFSDMVLDVPCDGTAQQWSITITPSSGLFKGGKATAHVFVSACDVFCGFDEATPEIQLTGGR